MLICSNVNIVGLIATSLLLLIVIFYSSYFGFLENITQTQKYDDYGDVEDEDVLKAAMAVRMMMILLVTWRRIRPFNHDSVYDDDDDDGDDEDEDMI